MKRYARSTLKRQTKDWLLDHIECLEHNIDVLNEQNAQQYENVKDWQPIKHGHWVWYYTSEETLANGVKVYTPIFSCTRCLHRYESYRRYDKPEKEDADYPAYCENCGAKMGEVSE